MKKELAEKLGKILSAILTDDETPKIEVAQQHYGGPQGPMAPMPQIPTPVQPFPPNCRAFPTPPFPWPVRRDGGNDDFHPDTTETIRQNADADPFPSPDGFVDIKEHCFSVSESDTYLNVIKEIDEAVKGFIASGFKEIDVTKFPKEFINYLDKCVIEMHSQSTFWAAAILNHCLFSTRQEYSGGKKHLWNYQKDRVMIDTLRKVYVFTQAAPPDMWAAHQPKPKPIDVTMQINPDGTFDVNALQKAIAEAMKKAEPQLCGVIAVSPGLDRVIGPDEQVKIIEQQARMMPGGGVEVELSPEAEAKLMQDNLFGDPKANVAPLG